MRFVDSSSSRDLIRRTLETFSGRVRLRQEKLVRVKLQYVATPTELGGLERVIQLLSAGLRKYGHQVLVVGVTQADDSVPDFFEALTASGVAWQRVVVAARDYRSERKAVREICRDFRPDVVHTHGYRCDVIDGAVAKSERIALVSTAHGYSGSGLRNSFYEWLQARALRSFGAVAAVSRPIVERLSRAGVPRERIHLVRNAYPADQKHLSRAEARAALAIPGEEFVVGWIGRFSLEKGPDTMLLAARQWSRSGISSSFVGDGPMQESLIAEMQGETQGAGTIRFHGRLKDAARYIRAFDVVALTSRTEGTPMVLLEAMAAEVPVVAMAVGGVPDMLDRGEAVLVPAGDTAAVVSAVEDLRADPDRAARLGIAAAARLRRDFDFNAWIENYLRIYRQVLSNGAAS